MRPDAEQNKANAPGGMHDFPPIQWDPPNAVESEHLVSAYFEEVNREELH
jgi:hypothetical protein